MQDALADPNRGDEEKDLIIPRVDGMVLTQIPAVQQFWIERQDAEAAEKSDLTTECLICGETQPIAGRIPWSSWWGQIAWGSSRATRRPFCRTV